MTDISDPSPTAAPRVRAREDVRYVGPGTIDPIALPVIRLRGDDHVEPHTPMPDRYGEGRGFCSCGASSARMTAARIREWQRGHEAKAKAAKP